MNKSMFVVCLLALIAIGCDRDDSAARETAESMIDEERTEDAGEDESQDDEAAADSEADGGASEVEVVALQHGSFLLEWGGDVIAVDPVGDALEAADEEVPEADLVLVTDIHGDHLDPEAIAQVRKEGAPVVAPQAVVDEAGDELPEPTVMENGDTQEMLDGELSVEATPMYNIERTNPDTGEPYHVEGRGNGYLLERDDTRVYISGDTECIPEMRELEDIDMAFVTMNVPYTMPVDEAAECIREFKPSVVYPFHYRGEDPAELEELLSDVPEVEVRVLEWYPEEE